MSQTTLGERDELWAAARSDPGDASLWPRLLAVHARLGRIEEGARRLRDLLLAAPRSKELDELYLETLWRGGHGLGDPGFQAPKPCQTISSPDRRHLALASAAFGLQIYETHRGSIVLDPVDLGGAFVLRWLDDERLVVVQRPDQEGEEKTAILVGFASVSEPALRVKRIELGAPWTLEQLRLDERGEWLCVLDATHLSIIELATERVARVAAPFALAADRVSFAPVGDLLYLARHIEGPRGHLLVDLRAAITRTFTADLDDRWRPAWSADGRYLALHGSEELVAPTSRNPWDDDDTGSPGVYRMLAKVFDTKDGSLHTLEGMKDRESTSDPAFRWGADGCLHVAGVSWRPRGPSP